LGTGSGTKTIIQVGAWKVTESVARVTYGSPSTGRVGRRGKTVQSSLNRDKGDQAPSIWATAFGPKDCFQRINLTQPRNRASELFPTTHSGPELILDHSLCFKKELKEGKGSEDR